VRRRPRQTSGQPCGDRQPAPPRKTALAIRAMTARGMASSVARARASELYEANGSLATLIETLRSRPFHKSGAGCAACPRCWRSRRTAVSSSGPVEQPPTSRCICSTAATTDARAIPAARPSPARAVVLARANAALSELVRTGSEVGVEEGGCSPTRARASVLAGRRGSGRQQAHRRLPQSRQRRAAGVADLNAGPSSAWRCAPLANCGS
jgi:hypothetical protein